MKEIKKKLSAFGGDAKEIEPPKLLDAAGVGRIDCDSRPEGEPHQERSDP